MRKGVKKGVKSSHDIFLFLVVSCEDLTPFFSREKPAVIFDVLKKKCKYKAIPLPTMELMAKHPKLHELETEWSNILSHQVPMLPPKEVFWRELPNMFAWLHDSLQL